MLWCGSVWSIWIKELTGSSLDISWCGRNFTNSRAFLGLKLWDKNRWLAPQTCHFVYMYLNLKGDFKMILNLRLWELPWNQIFMKVWDSLSLGELYRNLLWDLEMRMCVWGFSHDGSVVCGIFDSLHTFWPRWYLIGAA